MTGKFMLPASILTAAFLFGSMEVALKSAAGAFDSVQITMLRFLIGGAILLPFGLAHARKEQIHLRGKDHLWFLFLGFLCIPVSMMLFQVGVEHSNASTASVLFCINPVFTMMLAHFILKEELSAMKFLAFGLALFGILLMMRFWDLQEGNTVFGIVCMLAAAVTFSLYSVIGRTTLLRFGNTLQTSLSFLYGALLMLPFVLVTGRPVTGGIAGHELILLYIGVAVTGIGYLAYFKAAEMGGATTASIAFLIKPAIAPMLAVLLLGEHLLWNSVAGILVLISASVLNAVASFTSAWRKEIEERTAGQGRDGIATS